MHMKLRHRMTLIPPIDCPRDSLEWPGMNLRLFLVTLLASHHFFQTHDSIEDSYSRDPNGNCTIRLKLNLSISRKTKTI